MCSIPQLVPRFPISRESPGCRWGGWEPGAPLRFLGRNLCSESRHTCSLFGWCGMPYVPGTLCDSTQGES